MIFPGSPLAKKPPRWVMAAELVETSRLWARTVARIQPEWIEPLAGHLVKRTYSEPHWSRKRAGAVAVERVTLHGVPIVVGRDVDLGRIDPELARELFLRHALVEGDWDTRHAFFAANRALLDDVEELETRARRRDLVVDEDTLFAFYDARVPAEVVSGRHFDTWWKRERRRHPDLLDLTAEFLTDRGGQGARHVGLPGRRRSRRPHAPAVVRVRAGPGDRRDHRRRPGRRPAPGGPHAVHVAGPRAARRPGHRADQDAAQARCGGCSRPRRTTPEPCSPGCRPATEPLLDGLERELGRMRDVVIPRDAWELDRLPEHLTVTFRVLDERGREVARGTDLEKLRHELAPKVREELATAGAGIEATGLTTWSIGTQKIGHCPVRSAYAAARTSLTGYPGLVDRGTSVDVRVFPTAAERDPAHRRGVRRLLLLETPSPARSVTRGLDNAARLALSRTPHGSLDRLLDDCVTASVDALIIAAGGPAWDEASYAKLRAVTRAKLESTTARVLDSVRTVLTAWHRVQARIGELTAPVLADARRDLTRQVNALIAPGFVTAAGTARLGDLARYLQAVELRIDKLRADPARDAQWTAEVRVVADEYAADVAALPAGVEPSPELQEIRWMVEELRVALYAHPMRTRYPVSVKRIQKALDELPR